MYLNNHGVSTMMVSYKVTSCPITNSNKNKLTLVKAKKSRVSSNIHEPNDRFLDKICQNILRYLKIS